MPMKNNPLTPEISPMPRERKSLLTTSSVIIATVIATPAASPAVIIATPAATQDAANDSAENSASPLPEAPTLVAIAISVSIGRGSIGLPIHGGWRIRRSGVVSIASLVIVVILAYPYPPAGDPVAVVHVAVDPCISGARGLRNIGCRSIRVRGGILGLGFQ